MSGDSTRARWVPPIASAIIPGTGQLLQRNDRGAVYLIAEAFVLQRFVSLWTEAHREATRYRDLAFTIARAPFGPTTRDTTFEYFEQMGKFVESGPFDTDPGPALAPPLDPATYNGNIWALARKTFFTNPAAPPDTGTAEYRAALAFYRSRAVGPNFRWSWRDAQLEQDLFLQTIRQGDETFRRASQQLGLLLANHFLSAVDAFVSQRLARRSAPLVVSQRLWKPAHGGRPAWAFVLSLGF